MTPETPLTEVAHYLGQRTANYLLEQESPLQMACLHAVRSYLMMLENEYTLDPIELDARLDRYVRSFVMAYKGERYA